MKKLINEIRGEDSTELKAKLNDLRKEQFNLRFRGVSDGSTKNTRPREVRRTIARIMMVLGERERTGQTKGASQSQASQSQASQSQASQSQAVAAPVAAKAQKAAKPAKSDKAPKAAKAASKKAKQ